MNALRIVPLAVALAALPAAAQAPADSTAPRSVRAARAAGPMTIDGHLDEPSWAAAEAAADFTQSWPAAGARPTQRTEARVLYTDDAVYVGVRMFDARPDSIAAQLARRDASGIYSDWVHVVLDSYRDRRSAFRFSLNPRGVQKDVFHSNDTGEDINWDAVWQSAARVDSMGWTAEMRIPLSQLRFGGAEPQGGRTWGLQIQRDIARREERATWSPWTRTSPGYVSRFGDVTGLLGLRPVRRAEVVPYVSNRLTRAPGDRADPFYAANDMRASAGVDFKLGVTGGLTLTGTVNPDFGQVEVDPAEVNLSAFESFFPEKRPFFVEGSDVFRFGEVRSFSGYGFEEYFYSRRIGRQPQRRLDAARFSDVPAQSTILGAGKLSGKAGPWTLGVMDVVTSAERARFVTPTGERQTAVVEPLSNYLVGRVRRDLRGGRTVLGAMATATHRDLADDALAPLLRSRALFAGVDGEHSWAGRAWTLSGYLSGSRVDGSAASLLATQRSSTHNYQRPDADYLGVDSARTSLGGHMVEAALLHRGDWNFSTSYKESSPGFEINDLGFQTRTDFRAATMFLERQYNKPGRYLRDRSHYVNGFHAWNFGGDPIIRGVSTGSSFTFSNFWSVDVRAAVRGSALDDRLTRGGPLAELPSRWELSGNVGTDSRRGVTLSGGASFVRNSAGGANRSLGTTLGYRPSSAVRLRVSPQLAWDHYVAQYVRTVADPTATATFGARYVFADLRQTTASVETRLDWTFSPRLSLQLFAQPFIAAGDYSRFKELERPRGYDFAVYGRDRGTLTRAAACDDPSGGGRYLVDPDGAGPASCFSFGERDFNTRSLRGNAVLRWEYRPGSALFLVWQQERDGFESIGDFDLGRDAGGVFRAPARNVFLVKATYWLGR